MMSKSIRNIAESKRVRQVEKMYELVKMFNTWSELTITNSDVHQLLKYAITDNDEDANAIFDKILRSYKPSRIQQKMPGTTSTGGT